MINDMARRLLTARANKGLTRKQVAELIGVSDSLIGLYESAARQPSLSNLVKLASLYNVTTDYLLGCEKQDYETVSLVGLNDSQVQAIKLTIQCFKNQNT